MVLAVVFVLMLVFAAGVSVAVAVYDGPAMAFGPGGIHIGETASAVPGLVPLSSFTRLQRLVGASAVWILLMPILLMMFHGHALLRSFAADSIFAAGAARELRRLAIGALFYAASPLVAHQIALAVGVKNDPVSLHPHQIFAVLAAAMLAVVAHVLELGHEIERERDGFV